MIENVQYYQNVKKIGDMNLPWEMLLHKKILLTGATGLIGSFLVDVLMYRNERYEDDITIYAMGRNEERARKRFRAYQTLSRLVFLPHDIVAPLTGDISYDYIIHGASNTHPRAYASDPIGTITTNILGLSNLLEYSIEHPAQKIFLMSSVEVYGENRDELDAFREEDLGYIDCNTLRAGYPESKRVSESLCQAYISKYDMDIVIARFSRVYGPTMGKHDSKALAQFIRNAVEGKDIVLKSEGNQYYSYSYVADAVAALLIILLKGEKGEAYNIANSSSDITLKELAQIIAGLIGKSVVFELPGELEKTGYSTATKAVLDAEKLRRLGFEAMFSIEEGIEHTINILREESKKDRKA